MKLTSIIALNEGAYTKLAEWEAAAKKLGYTVTKDNKSGTYHAWDKTSHKGRFNSPTGKGQLTEGILNKIAGKVMGQAPTHKYKVGDDVSYEMDPPQEGGRGKGKITSVSKAGDHYTVNGKLVNHFEIKKKHASVKESKNSTVYAAGYDAFLADVVKNPHPAGSDDNREWNLGWEAAQSRSAVSESFNEPIVAEGLGDAIKRSVKKLTAPVKDPILDQMKSIADTANKRARAAQNVKYAPKAAKEAYTGHFNDDDWYEVDPKTNTVLRHAGGHADYRPTMLGQPIKLPNGNVLMRGMRAKRLKSVAEGLDPQDKLSKWTVTYDTYGSNKDIPLKKGATQTVYADTADAACAEVKKLVGGRNHKAECIHKSV